MKKKLMKKTTYLLFVVSFFAGCHKDNISSENKELISVSSNRVQLPDAEISAISYNTFYGPVVQMGNGHARTWINITHDNKALAFGVEITNGALENLPDVPEDERDFISGPADFLLALHPKARELTPYDHICINWNAHGHEPPGIYDQPHFDFHFYKITLADQTAIPGYPAAPTLFDNEPPAGFMPPLYFRGPGGIPKMGAHWVDILSPEFSGQPFTSTFIYGSYNGQVTFYEPMITMATIQSGVTIHKDIRQPLYFSPISKYYPTEYSIWKNETTNKHYISLDEMVMR